MSKRNDVRRPARWRAQDLPRIRDELVAQARLEAARSRSVGLAQDNTGWLNEMLVDFLPDAQLLWVSSEMTTVAVELSDTVVDFRPHDDRPSECGLIALERSTPPVTSTARFLRSPTSPPERLSLPVDLLLWICDDNQMLILAMAQDATIGRDLFFPNVFGAPQLSYHTIAAWMVNTELPITYSETNDLTQERLLSLINVIWTAMATPSVAERTSAPRDPGYERFAKKHRLSSEVTIVHLRPMKYIHHDEPEPTEEGTAPGRRYTHRFYVRGHIRNQAYGPNRALRRRIMVPTFIKGPEGAPLLERVYSWDRNPDDLTLIGLGRTP